MNNEHCPSTLKVHTSLTETSSDLYVMPSLVYEKLFWPGVYIRTLKKGILGCQLLLTCELPVMHSQVIQPCSAYIVYNICKACTCKIYLNCMLLEASTYASCQTLFEGNKDKNRCLSLVWVMGIMNKFPLTHPLNINFHCVLCPTHAIFWVS